MITCICHATRPPCHYCEESSAICDYCGELIYFEDCDDYEQALNKATHYHVGEEEVACMALVEKRRRRQVAKNAFRKLQ